jgi:uncharacterized protein (DUF1501 family)
MVTGGRPPYILDRKVGVPLFKWYDELGDNIHKLGENESNSIFAETANTMVRSSLRYSESLSATLAGVTLAGTTPWPVENKLAEQLQQVAKVISARKSLKAERDIFFVRTSGWDMHGDAVTLLSSYLGDVDAALAPFVDEMKAQGVWDSVVVPTLSEASRNQPHEPAVTVVYSWR